MTDRGQCATAYQVGDPPAVLLQQLTIIIKNNIICVVTEASKYIIIF